MDGSIASFLLEPPFSSGSAERDVCGILYVEDFDIDANFGAGKEVIEVCIEAPTPLITTAHLEAARADGRAEGLQAALTDAKFIQEKLLEAAVQSLTEALRAERSMLERVASDQAANCVRLVLAVLQSAIPAMMAEHAPCEAEAVVRALVPALAFEPELRVRVHPGLAEPLQETLAHCASDRPTTLSVVLDKELAVGDVHMTWSDGQAGRDCTSIWHQIRAALAPLNLPSLEDICLVD